MVVIKIPMYLDYKKSAMLFLLYGSAVPKWPSKIIVYKNRLLFEQIPLRKQPFFYFLCRLLPQFHFVTFLPYGQSANCFCCCLLPLYYFRLHCFFGWYPCCMLPYFLPIFTAVSTLHQNLNIIP